ncbi:hypothetical protein WICPIJ_004720, partial [Wickerhamomyces pijperi]
TVVGLNQFLSMTSESSTEDQSTVNKVTESQIRLKQETKTSESSQVAESTPLVSPSDSELSIFTDIASDSSESTQSETNPSSKPQTQPEHKPKWIEITPQNRNKYMPTGKRENNNPYNVSGDACKIRLGMREKPKRVDSQGVEIEGMKRYESFFEVWV